MRKKIILTFLILLVSVLAFNSLVKADKLNNQINYGFYLEGEFDHDTRVIVTDSKGIEIIYSDFHEDDDDFSEDSTENAIVKISSPVFVPEGILNAELEEENSLVKVKLIKITNRKALNTASSNQVTQYKKQFFTNLGIGDIVLREEWGAPQVSPWDSYLADDVEKIVVHHTATKIDTQTPSNAVLAVYNFHKNRCSNNSGSLDPNNPDCDEPSETWEDIGYNFLIDQNGTIYEGRYGLLASTGAHSPPNYGTVGISLIGDYSNTQPTDASMNSLTRLIGILSAYYDLDLNDPDTLLGHRERQSTACPGNYIFNYVDNLSEINITPTDITKNAKTKVAAISGNPDLIFSSTQDTKRFYINKSEASSDEISFAFDRLDFESNSVQTKDRYILDLSEDHVERFLKEIFTYNSDFPINPEYIYRKSNWISDIETLVPDDYSDSYNWNLDLMNFPEGWNNLGDCENNDLCSGSSTIKVAVLDTGIAYERYDYDAGGDYSLENLQGINIEVPASSANGIYNEGYDRRFYKAPQLNNTLFTEKGFDSAQNYICEFRSFTDSPCNNKELEKINHANDDDGHGTYVTSIISSFPFDGGSDKLLGIAPNITIMPVKIFFSNDSSMCYDENGDNDPECLEENTSFSYRGFTLSTLIIDALDYAYENGADIINLSIAGGSFDPALQSKINELTNKGVVVVAAAGNDGIMTSSDYPSAFENVIAVGAINKNLAKSYYSNYGDKLDFVAPVGDISGQIISGQTLACYLSNSCFDEDSLNFNSFTSSTQPVSLSGTSFAAPQITALVALVKTANPALGYEEIYSLLQESSIDLGSAGYDIRFGNGMIDFGILSSKLAQIQNGSVPLYRFYNSESMSHFFTADPAEKDYVINSLPQFVYEGIAYYVMDTNSDNSQSVYRFYSEESKSHFYTADLAEKQYVEENIPRFKYEGIVFNITTSEERPFIPVYRFYNSTTQAHFYTIDEIEKNYVINDLPQFKFEEKAYSAFK